MRVCVRVCVYVCVVRVCVCVCACLCPATDKGALQALARKNVFSMTLSGADAVPGKPPNSLDRVQGTSCHVRTTVSS